MLIIYNDYIQLRRSIIYLVTISHIVALRDISGPNYSTLYATLMLIFLAHDLELRDQGQVSAQTVNACRTLRGDFTSVLLSSLDCKMRRYKELKLLQITPPVSSCHKNH